MYLRLGNQSVLVRGAYAALLMDFYSGKMQRISLGVADLLDETVNRDDFIEITDMSQQESGVLTILKDRGFLHEVCARKSNQFSVDWIYPTFPTIRTISIELDGISNELASKFIEFVVSANQSFGMCSVVLLCIESDRTTVDQMVNTLLQRTKFLIINVVVQESRLTEFSEVARAESERTIISAAPPDNIPGHQNFHAQAVNKASFFCRHDYYHLLKVMGESYGCFHINKCGDVFPETMETNHKVGHIDLLSLDSLGNILDRSIPYWNVKKTDRRKCVDCEYRFVCPNPLSARSDKLDLYSEPGNCGYSPAKGVWA